MDTNRFDNLTKTLAEPQSRRRFIGILGAVVGGLFGGTAVASAAPRDDKPSKCYGEGSSCTNAKQCCSGTCTNRRCAGNGTVPQCKTAADCPGTDTDCRKRTCDAGVCGFTDAPAGTPAQDPKDGDCFTNVCDGSGGTIFVPDDTDIPAPISQCTFPVCSMGNSFYQPVPFGSPCDENGGKICDGNGTCIQTECFVPTDCPGQDSECRKRSCDFGKCGFSDAPPGSPISTQTQGDCLLNVCDGAGGVSIKADDGDVPTSPSECMAGICQMGIPSYTPLPFGFPCAGGTLTCDGFGNCQ